MTKNKNKSKISTQYRTSYHESILFIVMSPVHNSFPPPHP